MDRLRAPSLPRLAWLVARDVNRTFGGGTASMELLRRSFTRLGFLDDDGHGLIVAVSRLTPGTNLLAYCAALGWLLHGGVGTAVSLLAASVPASFAALGLAAALTSVSNDGVVAVVLALAMLGASVLVVSSAWHLWRPFAVPGTRGRAALVVGLALALFLAGLTPVRVLLAAAVLGAALPPRGRP